MKYLIIGIALVLIGCAGQPVDKKAQYEISYINVLEFYKGELQKCFDANDVYLESCPVTDSMMAHMGRIDGLYTIAMSNEVVNACNVSKLVAEAAFVIKFNEIGSLNLDGFCSAGEIDRILAGEVE